MWNQIGKKKVANDDYCNAVSEYRRQTHDRQKEFCKKIDKWQREIEKMSNISGTQMWSVTYDDVNQIKRPSSQGRDILKEIDEIRDTLLLLKRDVDMEAKYPRLRELKDQYEAALEKYKTFEAIKESK